MDKTGSHRARHRAPLPAVQHRAAVHARLRPAWPAEAVTTLAPGTTVFAGQRAEGFYVDLGAIFDLGDPPAVRAGPQHFGLKHRSRPDGRGCQLHQGVNVHSIAIQVPMSQLTANGAQPDLGDRHACRASGVWTTASRQKAQSSRSWPAANAHLGPVHPGLPAREPAGERGDHPDGREGLLEPPAAGRDSQFAPHVSNPELAGLLPVLYPGVFPNLAAYNADRRPGPT